MGDLKKAVGLFKTRELGIECGDMTLMCTGTLTDGTNFMGTSNEFKTVGCRDKDDDKDDKDDNKHDDKDDNNKHEDQDENVNLDKVGDDDGDDDNDNHNRRVSLRNFWKAKISALRSLDRSER